MNSCEIPYHIQVTSMFGFFIGMMLILAGVAVGFAKLVQYLKRRFP